MGDSRAAIDMDRLPWLADEDEDEAPRRRGSRAGLFASGFVLALILSGASYWLGTRSAAGPELFSGFSQVLPTPRAGQQTQVAEQATAQVTPTVPLPVAGDLPAEPADPAELEPSVAPAAPPRNSGRSAVRGTSALRASAGANSRHAPGCGDAAGADGRACDDSDSAYLATLDRQLSELYGQSWKRADATRRGLLVRSNELFVARLGTCRSDTCKSRAYHARMNEISEIEAGKWRSQANPVSTAGLAALDKHLSNFYGQSWTRADSSQRAMLLRSQDRFVNRLDACRTDPCKSGAYLARMREVSEIMSTRERADADAQTLSIRAK